MSVRQENRRDPKTGAVRKYWRVDIDFQHPDGHRTRIRKVSPVQTKRGAEQYERQLRQELLAGTYGKKKEVKRSPSLASFSDEFMKNYVEANNKHASVETKKMILRVHLKPALGELKLDRIGLREIEAYKSRKLREGLSPKTVNNHLSVLRKLLTVAVEWEVLDHVPPVKWLKVPEADFDFLTFEEADRLLAATEVEWRAMITVGVKAGLRQGELLGLRWGDVDLGAGRIVVRRTVSRGLIGTPKNGRSREVPLSDEALRALKAHRHLRGEYVFSNPDGGLLTKGECKWPLWRMCDRAGLRRIGWHVLRHTFASHLVMRGVPLKVVQELLGHASIKMTERYSHLSPNVHREAIRSLDRQRPHDGHSDETGPNSLNK